MGKEDGKTTGVIICRRCGTKNEANRSYCKKCKASFRPGVV